MRIVNDGFLFRRDVFYVFAFRELLVLAHPDTSNATISSAKDLDCISPYFLSNYFKRSHNRELFC
jgi:hypothetical protein